MGNAAGEGYNVELSDSFYDCVARHAEQNDPFLASLWTTINLLKKQPFGTPKLQTHGVGKARNGETVYSSDVGGRRSDRRLVWQLFNRTIVVLLYGKHKVQDQAKRMAVRFDADEQLVIVTIKDEDSGPEVNYSTKRLEAGRLFMRWTDAELADFGFAEQVVHVLRPLDSEDAFFELEERMEAADFERALNMLTYDHPDGEAAAAAELEEHLRDEEAQPEALAPEASEAEIEMEKQILDPRTGAWFSSAEPEFLKAVLDKPVEDWMVFLHPEQRAIVEASYRGPSRVRGSAGTGKTVVGLHRAAFLARKAPESDPILFTTFVKSLPPVFESLYRRLPGAVDNVEFVHIDRLASQLCRAHGVRLLTAPKLIDEAYATAWNRLVTRSSPLGMAEFSDGYIREEIAIVIKGRGLTTLDEYLQLQRTGRRARMGRAQRAQVWELMQEWDAEMEKRGTVDFADVVLRARDIARSMDEARFSGAIVDEAQDLTLVGLQLVRSLVNGPDGDRENGLMILGDGAQRIYPGGFTLKQAGISVTGRSTLLKVNYRNTREIIGLAMAVTGDGFASDHGEGFKRGDAPADALREGARPILVAVASPQEELDWLVRQVDALRGEERVGLGDIGVLVPTNRLVKRMLRTFREAGVAAADLSGYDGTTSDQIRVGTFHRGKGLEFKVVFLPGLADGRFPSFDDDVESEEELKEAAELAQSQLFVAMTRARDLLFVSYDRTPSSVLGDHLDHFERLEA